MFFKRQRLLTPALSSLGEEREKICGGLEIFPPPNIIPS